MDTKKTHFAHCNNITCSVLFPVTAGSLPGDNGFLCPECTEKSQIRHVVKCSCCGTVLNLVAIGKNEEPVTFAAKQCRHCIGTPEDEHSVTPLAYLHPHL